MHAYVIMDNNNSSSCSHSSSGSYHHTDIIGKITSWFLIRMLCVTIDSQYMVSIVQHQNMETVEPFAAQNTFSRADELLFLMLKNAKGKKPLATSGDNVYITWWSNKTGNDEVMFKASTDAGKTFSDKMNLSNTPTSDSQDVQISALGNNVYISWWERNQTSDEPELRVSNDNGKTFGETIMLSAK